MIVDCAVYKQGERRGGIRSITGLRGAHPDEDSFAWVGLLEPTTEEFEAVRAEFDLPELAAEDAVKAHQRPKLEIYGDTLFLVLKTAIYRDAEKLVEIGEVMLFAGSGFLISVRHGEGGGVGDVREGLEERPDLLRRGPGAALYALVDRVVDAYQPVINGVEEDIDEVEAEVFSRALTNPVERIYKLRREVLEFHRATATLLPALEQLAGDELPHVDPQIQPYFRDVADHLARVVEQVEGFRELLASILQANLTEVNVRQNADMRRISAWVAILAVPTMVAGIYGMNFEHMPELEWTFGYPLVLAVIGVVCACLYWRFRHAGWL
jgi:magnesium transporter